MNNIFKKHWFCLFTSKYHDIDDKSVVIHVADFPFILFVTLYMTILSAFFSHEMFVNQNTPVFDVIMCIHLHWIKVFKQKDNNSSSVVFQYYYFSPFNKRENVFESYTLCLPN